MATNEFDEAVGGRSRRAFIQAGAALAGGALLPTALIRPAAAADAALGTYPAGTTGSSVFVGICTPRTGTYAAQGEDEIKGYELAIEHLNAGNELIRQDLAEHQEGRARQGSEVRRRRQRGEAEHRRAGGVALHQREQGDHVHGLGVERRGRRATTSSPIARRSSTCRASAARTTRPARTACATRSASASTRQTAAKAIAPVLIKNIGKRQEDRLSSRPTTPTATPSGSRWRTR